MNEKIKPVLKSLLRVVAVILASVYLTFIVDIYTLNTPLKRIFVLGYFAVVCSLLVYLKKRLLKAYKTWKVMLVSGLVAAILLILFCGVLFPHCQEVAVHLEASGEGEVWLTGIEVDGKVMPLSEVQTEKIEGWIYSSEYDDWVFYPNDDRADNCLNIIFVAENISLHFAVNSWSGAVNVADSTGKISIHNLQTDNADQSQLVHSISACKEYSLLEYAVYGLGAWIILTFCMSCCIYKGIGKNLILKTNIQNTENAVYKGKDDTKTTFVSILALYVVLLITYLSTLGAEYREMIILIIVCLLCIFCFYVVLNWKRQGHKHFDSTLILPSLVAAFILVLFISNGMTDMVYPDQRIVVEATGQASDEAFSDEVWIVQIMEDNAILDLNNFASADWTYVEGALLYSGGGIPAQIVLEVQHPQEVTITFLSHGWSGIVGVNFGEGIEYYNLYSEAAGNYSVSQTFKPVLSGQGWLIILLGTILCAAVLCLSQISAHNSAVGRALPSIMFSVALPLSMWFSGWSISALILLTTLMFFVLLHAPSCLQELRKYKNFAAILAFLFITVFNAFLWSFNQIFTSPYNIRNGIMSIGFAGVSVIYAGATGICVLCLLEKAHETLTKRPDVLNNNSHRWDWALFGILFSIMTCSWLVWWVAYFPANMSSDSIDQWHMALGLWPLHDAHPLLSTLWIRFWSIFWESPGMVTLAQIVLSAAVYASVITSFDKRGVGKRALLGIGVVISLLPNIAIYVVTQWKDVPFLLALFLLAYFMQKICMGEKLGIFSLLLLFIALVAVSLLRHNGFLIALSCSTFLAYLAIRKHLLQIIVVVITVIVFVGIFNGPVFDAMNVEHYKMGLGATAMDCVGYTIYYDGNLPQDILDEAVEAAPISFWKEKFSPYIAHPYEFNGEKNLCTVYAQKSTLEQLSIIMRLFFYNPRIILYERMAMNDTNLFVYQSVARGSLNSRYANGILENDLGLVQRDTALKNQLNHILYETGENHFWDSILWRNGLAISFALWVIFFNFLKKDGIKNVIFIPMILNYLTLFIALIEQGYRYTHNVIVYSIFATLFAIIPKEFSIFQIHSEKSSKGNEIA